MANCPREHVAGWGATRRCHCAACHQDFSYYKNFDKHRDDKCLDPASVGLVLNERGVWTQPGEVDFYDRLSQTEAVR